MKQTLHYSGSVQAPSLSVQILESPLCSLLPFVAQFFIQLQEKYSHAIVTYNVITLQNLFTLSNMDILGSAVLWFHLLFDAHIIYCSWCYIIHHEYWLPMTLSKDIAMPHWCWPQMQVLPRACRKAWTTIYFVVMLTLPFGMVPYKCKATHYSMEITQMQSTCFQTCLLLKSLGYDQCSSGILSFSMLMTYHHQQGG